MIISKKTIIFVIVFVLLISHSVFAWHGRVVGISDGDTITVLDNTNAQFKIRLSGIDAPENGQPFGRNSKEFLSNLVYGKIIEVKPIAIDKYGRTVAHLQIDSTDVEEEMVRSGFAWVYDQYCTDPICTKWKGLQEQARKRKVGLWADPSPNPPWEWRHAIKDNQKSNNILKDIHSTGIFHGNINSHIFHLKSCKFYNCNGCVAVFNTAEDAIKAGYRPCKICSY